MDGFPVPGAPGLAASNGMPQVGRPPRSRALRVTIATIGVLLGFAVSVVIYYELAPESEAATSWPATALHDLQRYAAEFLGLLPCMIVTAVLGPRVSYRLRDLWWFLIPPSGFALLASCLYRWLLLPYRNWAPRPDEKYAVEYYPDLYIARRPAYRRQRPSLH